jgi:Fe-S cluster assembly iron-binding protein IscA
LLTLSENAATLLTQTRENQNIPDEARLRVAGAPDGAEGGLSLGFVEEPAPTDQTGVSHGIPMCVATEVAEALDGAQIDVQQSGDEAQLVIVPATE